MDRDLVIKLISDGYITKLEKALIPILTVKIYAYLDSVKRNKEFYKISLEHSYSYLINLLS